MSAEIIVLRLLHILGGVFWVGAITYATFFVIEVEALRARARLANLALTLILLASTALMAVARYL